MVCGCRFRVGFMRRVKGRKENKLVERKDLEQALCNRYVPAVNGIKGAAVIRNSFHIADSACPLSHSLSALKQRSATACTSSRTPMLVTEEISKNGLRSFFACSFRVFESFRLVESIDLGRDDDLRPLGKICTVVRQVRDL